MKDNKRDKREVQNLLNSRTEGLLDYSHSFSEIKDGISNISVRLLSKLRESSEIKGFIDNLKEKIK